MTTLVLLPIMGGEREGGDREGSLSDPEQRRKQDPLATQTLPPAATPAAPASTATGGNQDPLAALQSSLAGDTGATGTSGTTGTTGTTGTPGSSILSKMMSAESQYLPYLLSPNLRSTSEGQAVFESTADPIRTKYDTARQQIKDTLGARQGMSGLLGDELGRLDTQEAGELSDIERGFVGATTQRMGQATSELQRLLQEEQQRQTASIGIQAALDQSQRQRLNDLLAAIQPGTQLPAEAANIGQGLLGLAGQEAAQANQGWGSLGDLATTIAQRPQTQPTSTVTPGLSFAPTTGYDPALLQSLIGSPFAGPME
jgi:hypothetical protein